MLPEQKRVRMRPSPEGDCQGSFSGSPLLGATQGHLSEVGRMPQCPPVSLWNRSSAGLSMGDVCQALHTRWVSLEAGLHSQWTSHMPCLVPALEDVMVNRNKKHLHARRSAVQLCPAHDSPTRQSFLRPSVGEGLKTQGGSAFCPRPHSSEVRSREVLNPTLISTPPFLPERRGMPL